MTDDLNHTLGYLNDMWMFNVTSGWWTWLSGSNAINQAGLYGVQGMASLNNFPGARVYHSMVMHPSGQLIFVFGGYGYDTVILGMPCLIECMLIESHIRIWIFE